MASPVSLTRMAFRPLSTRCQCRFASSSSLPTGVRQSSTGGLASELLKSIEKSRQQPQDSGRVANRALRAHYERRGSLKSVAEHQQRTGAAVPENAATQSFTRKELERYYSRRWNVGDVYSPKDLTGVEQKKWKTPVDVGKVKKDIFDQLGINPIREYKNFALMAEFVSETGRIRPRSQTGLRPVNQRRIAKAIRRAVGCGLMPRTYRHPELIKRDRGGLAKRMAALRR